MAPPTTPTKKELEDDLLKKLSTHKTSSLSADEIIQLKIKQLEKQRRFTVGDSSLGKLKSWEDFARSAGFKPSEAITSQPYSSKLIKEAFAEAIEKVKNEHIHKTEEITQEEPRGSRHDTIQQTPDEDATAISRFETEGGRSSGDETETPSTGTREVKDVIPVLELVKDDEAEVHQLKSAKANEPIEDEFSYIPALQDNPKVQPHKFQIHYTSEILRHFMVKKLPAAALSGGVGVGKTFVIGAAIRELWDREWEPLKKSIAMFPVLYVTRASIVKQTERVLFNKFGLRPGHEIYVTNIDQLRSSFGTQLFQEKIIHQNGVPYRIIEWFDVLAPALTVLDEAHAVKNIHSRQSRVMQALNDCPGEHYMLYASATLWTRVVEAKCFAVATKMEW